MALILQFSIFGSISSAFLRFCSSVPLQTVIASTNNAGISKFKSRNVIQEVCRYTVQSVKTRLKPIMTCTVAASNCKVVKILCHFWWIYVLVGVFENRFWYPEGFDFFQRYNLGKDFDQQFHKRHLCFLSNWHSASVDTSQPFLSCVLYRYQCWWYKCVSFCISDPFKKARTHPLS